MRADPNAAATAIAAMRPAGYHSETGWVELSDLERATAILADAHRRVANAADAVLRQIGGVGTREERDGSLWFLADGLHDLARTLRQAVIVQAAERAVVLGTALAAKRRERRGLSLVNGERT